MSAALDTRQQVLDAAITGVFRVAEAILATPAEKRTKALDAAANSYRQTAQDLDYNEAEIQELLDVIMFRLRTEVAARELVQRKSERHDEDAHRSGQDPLLKNNKNFTPAR
jgi:hypothetical protein